MDNIKELQKLIINDIKSIDGKENQDKALEIMKRIWRYYWQEADNGRNSDQIIGDIVQTAELVPCLIDNCLECIEDPCQCK